MIEKRLELIISNEKELDDALGLIKTHNIETIYATPEHVSSLGVTRNFTGKSFKIWVIVDYPKGLSYNTDKFKGTDMNFYLSDGYDIVLSNNRTNSEIRKEIADVSRFVKTMIDPHIPICFSINRHLRDKDQLNYIAETLLLNPVNKIKLEAQAKIQPTKANFEVHKSTVELFKSKCSVPIVVSGNINYKICNEMAKHQIAVSPSQFTQILNDIEKKKRKSESSESSESTGDEE